MLVRDADHGVEVFLMERHQSAVFGGLTVFPGGKVDGVDRTAELEAHCVGPSDAEASRVLRLPHGGLAYWVACIRECFEEAGLLLAYTDTGELIELRDPARRARFAAARARLNAGETGALDRLCADEGVRLATDHLAYVAHWITPVDQPRRFDTRFFVARAPEHQEAIHDGYEAVHSQWLRPEEALDRSAAGALTMISPTVHNLQALCGYADADALLADKAALDPATIPTILPRVVRDGEFVREVVEELDVES